MGPNVDKLFLEVAGRPIVAHTWERFDRSPTIDEIIVVVRDGMQSAFAEMAEKGDFHKPHRLVAGGKERQDSVWNGIQATAAGTEIIAIHDGARPCVSEAIIADCVRAAREHGAAVAASEVIDTIKEAASDGTIACHIDRAKLRAVQTPQTFRAGIIRRALAEVQARGIAVTDDTAACELIGQSVRLVESATPNPKATSPSDLPWLEMLLRDGAA
jgi:2-C-methyl-D-erythritol 4-phosphate cytidylyltransferase